MIELDYDFIYTKYWLEEIGWSINDLALYYNVHPQKILRFMRHMNIETRSCIEGQKEAWKCPYKYIRKKKFKSHTEAVHNYYIENKEYLKYKNSFRGFLQRGKVNWWRGYQL